MVMENEEIDINTNKYFSFIIERADPCDKSLCRLPDCACANERQPPKGLAAKKIPQMILLSWEDGE